MTARFFVLLSLLMAFTVPAGAATFSVDNLSDGNDAAPGDGVCNNGDGTCSLRSAVQEANALAGPDRIELVAGTHELSFESTPQGGSPILIKLSMESNIEVVGAGIGQTIIFSEKRASSGFMDVFLNEGTELVTFRDLTFDVQTGGLLLNYLAVQYPPGQTALLLEDIELLANTTVPSNCCGAGALFDTAGSGSDSGVIVLRRAFVQSQRVAANGVMVTLRHSGGLVIEDSTFDGGNQYQVAVLQNFLSGQSGPVTVRDSVFRNFLRGVGPFGPEDAVFRMRLFDGAGQLTIERSTFESSFRGVSVRNRGFQADVTITDSLFTGVSNAVRVSGPATVPVINTTISGGGTGVALVTPEAGSGLVDLTLENSTVTGAATSVSVGAGLGTVNARNSIIANGTTECVGALTSAGHNLVEGACTITGDTTGNITGTDPQLLPLADNGGPTQTHALDSGSPAVDAGDDANCQATDQRGFGRPADGDGDSTAKCDIGAYEKDAVLVTNVPPVANEDTPLTDEDAPATIDVSANDTDPDGNLDPSSTNTACGTCSTPTNGSLVNNGDGMFDYTPDPDFFGSDSFVYEICDTDSACDTATVDITVNPVNDPPTFAAGADPDFPAGTSGPQSIANWPENINLGPNETQQADSYAVITTSDPDSILAGSAAISTGGELTFSLTGASGTAQFEATLTDDGGTANGGDDTSSPVAFSITVEPPEADMVFAIMRCSEKAAPGEFYPYGFLVENRGPDAAEGVALTHTPITGATVISISSPDCVENVNTVDCDFGTLAPGQNVPVGLRIVAPTVGAQVLPMTINGASDTIDPNLGNNDVGATVEIVPGLVIADGFEACGPCGVLACSR